MKKILFLILILPVILFSQNKDPYKIISSVKDKYNKIKDYEADVKIKIDIEFLNAPEMNAKIYYKAPDRTKLDSKDFAMLPKQAFNFSPNKFMSEDFSAIYVSSKELNGNSVDIIKVIPNSDTSQIVLSTLWIDPVNNVIRRVEATLKQGSSFQLDMNYSTQLKNGLPSSVKFTFDMSSLGNLRRMGNDDDRKKPNGKKPMPGTVEISYSNYKINKGIPDKIFEGN